MLSMLKILALTLVWSLTLGSLGWCQSEDGEGVFVKVYPGSAENGDLAEVNNTKVDLVLRCESRINPTEWVLDYDETNITSPKFPCGWRTEWTTRWSVVKGHMNKSLVRLRCDSFASELTLGCRSVTNHSDNVMVKLEPNQTTELLYITNERGALMESEEPQSSLPCVRFTLAQLTNENHWKCEGPNGESGKVSIRYCHSTADCASTQRKLKLVQPVCVDRVTTLSLWDYRSYLAMSKEQVAKFPGGTIICKIGKAQGAAVEFFFAGKDKSTFHFSLSEISMNDLIWFDPIPTSPTFYTADVFETRCKVSNYGLAWRPRLEVKLNGTRLDKEFGKFWSVSADSTYTQKVNIGFDGDKGFGPGVYEIDCSAPVWNTSEWATQALKFEVRPIVPPYFDVAQEHVAVQAQNGDPNVRLRCDARGDPMPSVTWDHGTVPGLRSGAEGRDLTFTALSVQWVNVNVSCTAVSKYGQRATKIFQVHIESGESSQQADDGSNSWTWTVTAVLASGAILALAVGLGYLYYRFVRFGRAVAQVLSDEEVKEFQEGRAPSAHGVARAGDETLVIECLPYNSEFEVAKEHFYVDLRNELGSGHYGVVYMGHIKLGSDERPVPVAVKTVRQNVPPEYFKALLSELKILAHIGQHENIANLVGADSSNIKSRELYVGVEFCKTSLLQHLRKNAGTFRLDTGSRECGEGYGNIDRPINILDLIRWSGQIAAGMEYLSAKRIVHGDLAARNVLLSFEMRAKICDFGLARQLVDYTYIKATTCNLPWKWMAIESLRQMHFSSKSDVWSYGITCWEIFSLGDVPYPCMAWSWEFVNGLVAGQRLTQPKHASPEIFSMLLQCWFEKKERRPTFTELKTFFQEQEQKLAGFAAAYVNVDEFN